MRYKKEQMIALRREGKLLRNLLLDAARKGSFMAFVEYVNTSYATNWHQKLIADKLQSVIEGKIKKLMLFMPPQHGKSELASRMLPAYALGVNPNLKIAACSYSGDLAKSFNRDVQRIMDYNDNYIDVFPKTRLGSARVANDSRGNSLRNTSEFSVVGHTGSYKSVGVGGGLSGRAVDMLIIDDPIKDYKEASSPVVRETVWNWYLSVAETRLHNDSVQVLIMTRWHQDDLAGRLMKQYPGEWEVINIPAIAEDTRIVEDPRRVGEALWPQRHSLERLLSKKRASASIFSALYQQQPTTKGGGILKGAWLGRYNPAEIDWSQAIIHFYLDSAYTEKQHNDPTCVLAGAQIGNNLYLVDVAIVRMEFPDLIRFIPDFMLTRGAGRYSALIVEPKASGLSIIQTLRYETNLTIVQDEPPKDSKVVRATAVAPTVEGRRVFVPDHADWVANFIAEIEVFPNGAHDDQVDCLVGLMNKTILAPGRSTRIEAITV